MNYLKDLMIILLGIGVVGNLLLNKGLNAR